jgi:tetratricopeptide (TPR) repeat protein
VSNGAQIAANTVDGSASELFSLQDNLADAVARDLHFPSARRRSTVSPGLDGDQQAKYLQAVGLLQRYDRRDAVERAVEILRGLAGERPNSAPVNAALGRASLAMFDFTKDRAWADRAIASADAARSLDPSLPEVDVTVGRRFSRRKGKGGGGGVPARARRQSDDFRRCWGWSGGERGGDGGSVAFSRPSSFSRRASRPTASSADSSADRGRWIAGADVPKASPLAPDSYRAFSNLGGVSTMSCGFPRRSGLAAGRSCCGRTRRLPRRFGRDAALTGRYGNHRVAGARRQVLSENFQIQANLSDAYRAVKEADERTAAATRSIALAREQLRLNPRDAIAHSYAATGLAKTNHAAEAAAEVKEALDLDPKEPSILLDAAVVAALAGQPAEAMDSLRKAVALGYCRTIIARQPEFERFRKDPAFQAIVAAPPRAAGI